MAGRARTDLHFLPSQDFFHAARNNARFNTRQEIGAGIGAIVQTLRAKLPETKILVLGTFFHGDDPTPEPTALAKIDEIASELVDGKQVLCLDLHPGGAQFSGNGPAEARRFQGGPQ